MNKLDLTDKQIKNNKTVVSVRRINSDDKVQQKNKSRKNKHWRNIYTILFVILIPLGTFTLNTLGFFDKGKKKVEIEPLIRPYYFDESLISEIQQADDSLAKSNIRRFGDKYGYYSACYFEAIITNKGDNEIKITEFALKAKNIIQNNKPVLSAYGFVKNGRYYASVINEGWGTASDINIRITDENRVIEAVTEKSPYKVLYPSIEAAEQATITLISMADIKNTQMFTPINYMHKEYMGVEVIPNAFISCVESPKEESIFTGGIVITNDGIFDNGGGMGAAIAKEYIIILDANKSEQIFHKETDLIIPPHETLNIPICISANRSCSFSLDMKIMINGNKEHEWGSFDNINLMIPSASLFNAQIFCDGENIPAEEPDENAIVYFPFIKNSHFEFLSKSQ